MRNFSKKLGVFSVLLSVQGVMAFAEGAPSGQIKLVTLNPACETQAGDRARLALVLRTARLVSDVHVGRVSSSVLHEARAADTRFLNSYSDCRDRQDALEQASIQPGGAGTDSAKKALDQAVRDLRAEVRSVLSSVANASDSIDVRLDSEIENRYVGFIDKISQGHQLLPSGEALRVKLRDYLTRATQLSVDCRVLAKSGQDSSECERKVTEIGARADQDFQQHLARSVDAASTLATQLEQKFKAQSVAVMQVQSLQRFLQQVPQMMQNLGQAEAGTLRAIPHHSYWAQYHWYWARYFGPTGPGRNPVYGQAHLGAMYQNIAALNSYQQQLAQIRSQMQSVMAQAQAAQGELNGLPTKIQNLTLDVATIKQRIVSL